MNDKELLKMLKENSLDDLIKQLLYEEGLEDEDLAKLSSYLGAEPKFVTSNRTVDNGDADSYQWIFKLDDQYFRVVGDYCSWNGTTMYLSTLHEVEKHQKTVTVWKNK